MSLRQPPEDVQASQSSLDQTQDVGGFTGSFVGHSTTDGSDRFKMMFQQIVNMGVDFKSQKGVANDRLPIPSTKTFGAMPEHGMDYDQLLLAFEEIARTSANWSSPNFMGFPDSGNSVPAIAAAILIPLLNQNLANQDICSPSASFVEMEVVHWLREQLGYQVPAYYSSVRDLGGILTLGGCLSNTIALMAARESLFPGSGKTGLPVLASTIRVLVPDIIEHYSIRSAMAWLGMGEENVVRVPVDETFRIQLEQLNQVICEERSRGHHIVACIAYAGDSRTMRVDNLQNLADLLHAQGIWFHVDACHGSQLAFSKIHRHKISGIESADSVTIDPHKVLWIPNTCSYVLFKDPQSLADISTNSDLILKTQWSLGQITPCIGSKAFDSLKIWAVIKYFGKNEIGRLIDTRLGLTISFQEEIASRPDFLLLNDTDINSCVFLYLPRQCQMKPVSVADLEKINACNLSIKTSITEAGNSYLHGFNLKRCPHPLLPDQAVYVLRTMNGNPLTELEHMKAILDDVAVLGAQFFSEQAFRFRPQPWVFQESSAVLRLQELISSDMKDIDHIALVYGSSVSPCNAIQSDIDLMIFAEDSYCTPERIESFRVNVIKILQEEGIAVDAEVPYEKKLLVPLSLAEKTSVSVPFISSIPRRINKSQEYLASEEMLHRLVLNVLTVPTIAISGSATFIKSARDSCESRLLSTVAMLAKLLPPSTGCESSRFARTAIKFGDLEGEDFLGYKNRPETINYLREIHRRSQILLCSEESDSHITMLPDHNPRAMKQHVETQYPPCVLLLNGFPGVGKFTIMKALEPLLSKASTRFVDNHLLIDLAEAIEPGRSELHHRLRGELRRSSFDRLKSIQEPGLIIIMTTCLAQLPEDLVVLKEHMDIARVRGIPLIVANITCDEAVNVQRLQSSERAVLGGKTKLTNARTLTTLREIVQPLDVELCRFDRESINIHAIEINNTQKEAGEVATQLFEMLREGKWSTV